MGLRGRKVEVTLGELRHLYDLGYKQKEIAEQLDICPATVCKYLKGYKRQPVTDKEGERVPLKAGELEKAPVYDPIAQARERFNARMQEQEAPVTQSPLAIAHIAYDGMKHYYNLRGSTIQVYDHTGNTVHMDVDYIDSFIEELKALKRMITSIQPLLKKEQNNDDTSDD